jgi:hypothetical protein
MPYAASPPAERTIEVTGAPPAPSPWEQIKGALETPIFGVPLWVWLTIGGLGITGVGVAAYAYEEERRRSLMLMAAR